VTAIGIGSAHRLIRGLALLSSAVVLAGCADGQHTTAPPTGHSPTPVYPAPTSSSATRPATRISGLPDPGTVDGKDPSAVSRAALTIMWTTDASTDSGGQHDAQLRSVPFLTPAYAAQIEAAQPSPPPPDAWVRNRVHTRVQMRPGDEETPPDTPTAAYRQWILTVTSVDAKGRRQVAPVRVVAYVILARAAGQPWRVAAVNTY
jgi:hypothetical protein